MLSNLCFENVCFYPDTYYVTSKPGLDPPRQQRGGDVASAHRIYSNTLMVCACSAKPPCSKLFNSRMFQQQLSGCRHHVRAAGETVTGQPSAEVAKRQRWVTRRIGTSATLPHCKRHTSNANLTSGLHLSVSRKETKVLNNRYSLGGRRPKLRGQRLAFNTASRTPLF